MPVDAVRHPVDVLLQLPDQPALADAARTGDRNEPHAALAADGTPKVADFGLARAVEAPGNEEGDVVPPTPAGSSV